MLSIIWCFILKMIHINTLAALDELSNRVGAGSISTMVLLSSTKDAVELATPWAMTDWALLISMIGGGLFIVEKLFMIYTRYAREKREVLKTKRQLP